MSESKDNKVRLDKWLWAARFFKTRSLCKAAIDGGKVQYVTAEQKTQRVKANKVVNIGDVIEVRQGWDAKVVVIDSLSEHRGKAIDAAKLYHETEESLKKREANQLIRNAARDSVSFDQKKPDKRDRRRQMKFHEDNES